MIEKIKGVLQIIGFIICGIFAGVFLLKSTKSDKEIEAKATEAGDEKYEEIESSDAADLVASAGNRDELSGITEGIKLSFRERIRNRFRQKL